MTEHWKIRGLRALGELAIIVIGVTIALWADTWVSERQSRDRELARLEALADNIATARTALQAEIRAAAEASEVLGALIVAPDLATADQRQKLRFAFLYGPSFTTTISAYDDLKNSGELSLLTDSAVRRSLAAIDAGLQQIRLAQNDLATVQQLQIDSFAMTHLDARAALTAAPTTFLPPLSSMPRRLQNWSTVVFAIDCC